MRMDEPLLKDYRETFALMKQLGFEDLCVWGLYVSRAWPVDIASCGFAGAGKLVDKLISGCSIERHPCRLGTRGLLLGIRRNSHRKSASAQDRE